MERTQEKRRNNKGFSLVELIIVIAIMAVLVGIMAPQFIKYVERSKESTDIKNFQEVISSIQVYAADSMETDKLATGTINFTATLTDVASGAGKNCSTTAIAKALTGAGITKIQTKSTKYATVTLTITVTDGVPKFTTDVPALSTALGL